MDKRKWTALVARMNSSRRLIQIVEITVGTQNDLVFRLSNTYPKDYLCKALMSQILNI